jgi:hypothetical protein
MPTHTNKKGQTVVLAYVAVIVITVLGGSLLNHSFTANRDAAVQQLQADVLYMAEGGLEDAIGRFAQAIANFQIDPNIVQYPVAGVLATTFTGGGSASSTVAEAEPAPRSVADPDGISIFEKNYRVRTTVNHPTGGLAITLNQIVKRRIIYTFQHAIFYDKDLEWLPGPDMTLSGRVHSNSDIYIGTHNLLTIDNEYLRAAGKIYNRRKDSSTAMNGTVQIKRAGSSPAAFIAMAGLDSDSPTWTAESQARWNGTVKTGVHGVTKRAVPVVGSTAPGGFYDLNADVKVVNGTVTKGGVPLIEGTDIPVGTIRTTTTFYNNREGKTIKMTEINLRKLAGYADADTATPSFPNRLPANGLLYATRSDTPASQQPGVRLVNGQVIERAAGLTVVTNDPLYIQGHFNIPVDSDGDGTLDKPKKPTAVIADAVNLLSVNWSDANSTASLTSRVAQPTTVNAAFIAGIKQTSPGNYNGGLENYPRFHESWTSKTLSITGSFVSLWDSQIATGNWVYGAPQYTAPLRNWHYDTSFSNGMSMPPFTPYAVEMVKGAWWKE